MKKILFCLVVLSLVAWSPDVRSESSGDIFAGGHVGIAMINSSAGGALGAEGGMFFNSLIGAGVIYTYGSYDSSNVHTWLGEALVRLPLPVVNLMGGGLLGFSYIDHSVSNRNDALMGLTGEAGISFLSLITAGLKVNYLVGLNSRTDSHLHFLLSLKFWL